jgi:hypothetical protein
MAAERIVRRLAAIQPPMGVIMVPVMAVDEAGTLAALRDHRGTL